MINFITGIESTSAALQAERVRMAVASENMANANTTKGLDGLPYQRQSVVFESVLANEELGFAGISPQKVQISRIEKDQSGPRMVYDPGHPDADSTGMATMPVECEHSRRNGGLHRFFARLRSEFGRGAQCARDGCANFADRESVTTNAITI